MLGISLCRASADAPPSPTCIVAVNTPVSCSTLTGIYSGSYVGVVNLSQQAQGVGMTIYDNPTSCMGTVLDQIAPLGPTQKITEPGGGTKFFTGVTACTTGVPTANGIKILIHP